MDWLTLKEASTRLGVHPATLRLWADQGHVRIFRTPGGHRRFSRVDLENMMQRGGKGNQLPIVDDRLISTAVAQARRDVSRLRGAHRAWLNLSDDREREAWRENGRRLIGLGIQYVAKKGGRQSLVDEARRIGSASAEMCLSHDMPLSVMVRSFFFFRESVLKATRPGQTELGQYDEEEARIHRDMRHFLDEAFYAMLDACDRSRLREVGARD